MDKFSIVSQIEESDDLLSLPQALAEILKEVDKPDFNSEMLAKIILKDPPLTGRILKLANSSMYRRFSDTTTVNQAVQLLGVTTVKCLALSSSVFHPEKIEAAAGVNPSEYFANVLTVASACEVIAQAVGFEATEEAFITGLLHDIGTMFFLHHYPEEYRDALDYMESEHVPIVTAENHVYGIDHCTVGYHLASRWRLPDYVAAAIRSHHAPADKDEKNRISAVLRLGSLMVEGSNPSDTVGLENRLRAISQASEALGLSKDQIDELSVSLMSSAIQVAGYLDVDIGDIEEMLTRANREIWRAYLMMENLFKERQEMNRKLLEEERARGAFETKAVAMATLSHYLNNIAMAIYGRSQMMRMQYKKGQKERILDNLVPGLDVIDKSIRKMVAVLAEMNEVSPIDHVEFLNTSKAMNMDDRIAKRMEKMDSPAALNVKQEPVAG